MIHRQHANVARLLILGAVFLCVTISAQVPVLDGRALINNPTPAQIEQAKRREQILIQTQKLRRVLTTDRSAYLLGEVIRFRLTIENPLANSMEVLDPLSCQAGGVISLQRVGNTWRVLNAEAPSVEVGLASPAVKLIGGWQTISREFQSSDKSPCNGVEMSQLFEPGTYRVRHTYGGAPVEFQIVPSKIIEVYHVPLATPEIQIDYKTKKALIDPRTGKPVETPRELLMATVATSDKYYLIVTRFGLSGDTRVAIGPERWLDYPASRTLGPFVRIAESVEPITLVSATADLPENLTVTWATPDGRTHIVLLNPDREIVSETEK